VGGHGYVTGIFFDLTKPYNVINLDILLDKLNPCGARGITKMWYKPHFSHWTQFLK
jgi:hypothetical protein